MSEFTIGQKLEGDGLAFEVIQVEPVVRVKCLTVSKFWQNVHCVAMPNNPSVMQETWVAGKEYELREATVVPEKIKNYVAASHLLPWHIFYTNGLVQHYR